MLQIFALCCLIIGVSFMFYFRNLSPFIFHRLVCIKRVGVGVACFHEHKDKHREKPTKTLNIEDKKNLSTILNQGKKGLLKYTRFHLHNWNFHVELT